jgi:ribonuclease P protein component
MYETDVPAQCAQTRQDPRFPQANVDQSRSGGYPFPTGQGAPPAHRLTAGLPTPRPGPIRSQRVFAALRQSPARGRSGPIGVSFAQVRGSEGPLVGYAVSRRVGAAVVRNRLRRRIRVVMRDLAPSLEAGAYLISAAPGATMVGTTELREAVTRATQLALARREGKAQVRDG